MVELHREGSAPAVCAADLFIDDEHWLYVSSMETRSLVLFDHKVQKCEQSKRTSAVDFRHIDSLTELAKGPIQYKRTLKGSATKKIYFFI